MKEPMVIPIYVYEVIIMEHTRLRGYTSMENIVESTIRITFRLTIG